MNIKQAVVQMDGRFARQNVKIMWLMCTKILHNFC